MLFFAAGILLSPPFRAVIGNVAPPILRDPVSDPVSQQSSEGQASLPQPPQTDMQQGGREDWNPPPVPQRTEEEILQRMALYSSENDVQHLNELSCRLAQAMRRGDDYTIFKKSELHPQDSAAQLADAFHAARLQDPMICSLPSGASGVWDGGGTLFTYRYRYLTGVTRAGEMMAQLDEKANRVLATILSDGMTPREISDAIEHYLAENSVYDYKIAEKIAAGFVSAEIAYSQTAHSSLVGGRSVCTGASLAYTLLARRAGLDAICVSGTLSDGSRHVWNRVLLDEQWVTVDVTMRQVGREIEAGDRTEDDLYQNNY